MPLLSALPQKAKADYAKERHDERKFILDFLKTSPSKRTTNAYLSRFALSKKAEGPERSDPDRSTNHTISQEDIDRWQTARTGVNLGNLYVPIKAIEENPIFAQHPLSDKAPTRDPEVFHVALIKLRQPQILDDDTLDGLGITISQLVRLGLNIAVVVDCDSEQGQNIPAKATREWFEAVSGHVDRVVAAIAEHNSPGALNVNGALGYAELQRHVESQIHVRGQTEVRNTRLLRPLLESGVVPVLLPTACTTDSNQRVRVSADDVMLALTREFAGITSHALDGQDKAKPGRSEFLVDRIIVLDPLGGIHSEERPDKAHVFINLEEEYGDIKNELRQALAIEPSTGPSFTQRHLMNLEVVQRTLQLLPPSSSALIISPSVAAAYAERPDVDEKTTGVRTRRQKNPLIYNLLTDKPVTSSSLPLSRFSPPSTMNPIEVTSNKSTFVKKGMPLTLIPDPRIQAWKPPGPEGTTLSLTDPSIDFPRLLHLIEDSFGRKLDVEHYLNRIKNRLAGIIIAGEYEGGAILTWETPPNYPDSPPVPYLDKFAVLRRAQGTGGVADVVFKALLRQCFPKGCVWRSRSNNPVNKWYFERSAGHLKLPGGQWTMFWSVEDGYGQDEMDPKRNPRSREERWKDWVDVCQNVEPSWADNKRPD